MWFPQLLVMAFPGVFLVFSVGGLCRLPSVSACLSQLP